MLDTVDFNHVQHISFTQSLLTDAVSVILSELLSYEHPPKRRELLFYSPPPPHRIDQKQEGRSMIVIAAKVSVRKILACVLAAGTVLTGAAVLLPADAQPAAAASENMRLDVKLRTNEQRVALLRDCGWEVIEEPRGEREVQIPEEFDEVYESYNQIQLAQGLDLTPCRGRRATLYTYEITNHPSGEQGVTANLLVRRGKLIAADVSSPQADGFVHGLREHPSEPQDTP